MVTRFISWLRSLFAKPQPKQSVLGTTTIAQRVYGMVYNRQWARAMAQFCDYPKDIPDWSGHSHRHQARRARVIAAGRINRRGQNTGSSYFQPRRLNA